MKFSESFNKALLLSDNSELFAVTVSLHGAGRARNSDEYSLFKLDSTQERYIPSNSQETSLQIYRYGNWK